MFLRTSTPITHREGSENTTGTENTVPGTKTYRGTETPCRIKTFQIQFREQNYPESTSIIPPNTNDFSQYMSILPPIDWFIHPVWIHQSTALHINHLLTNPADVESGIPPTIPSCTTINLVSNQPSEVLIRQWNMLYNIYPPGYEYESCLFAEFRKDFSQIWI